MVKQDKCAKAYHKYIKSFANITSKMKILDVGCGTGNYTSLFTGNNNTVYGIDIKDRRSDKFYDAFNFIKYDGMQIPFMDKTFDLVISFDVIEHINNDFYFLTEIKRVLKDDGKIFISTPNRNRLSNILFKIIGKPVKYPYVLSTDSELGEIIHIREYKSKELRALVKKTGFENITISHFWFGLRGFVDKGIALPLIPSISQYLFLVAKHE